MNIPSGGYPPEQLIFVLGIMPRSGTNYLFDLLLTHADCAASRVPEDFLVAQAHWLNGYVDAVYSNWNPRWGLTREDLYARLRPGLVDLLAGPDERRRVVSKTPSMDNLDLFERLFPTARLILLVRDGRSVVESGMKSFDWTFDAATRRWADTARNLARFDRANRGAGARFRIVRYEDLYGQPEVELPRIHDFLGLDPTDAKFADLADLPVRGSSVRGDAADVHWTPVAKPTGFNPLERFSHWTPAQHARFNWLAGDAMALFGYETTPPAGPAAYWRARNLWLDAWQTWNRRRERLWRRLMPGGVTGTKA